MKNKIIIGILILSTIFISCKSKDINIESTGSTNISPTAQWMVINVSYGTFKESANLSSTNKQECRLGDVFLVEGKKVVKAYNPEGRLVNQTWYKSEYGWILENSVLIYDTKLKAISISNKLLK